MRFSPRFGAVCFSLGAALFILYPLTRPWHDETTSDGVIAAMGSSWWLASHSFAMVGFMVIPLGLLSLHALTSDTRGESAAWWAVLSGWTGSGLTLTYYGLETFGLHAMAQANVADPVSFADTLRNGPLQLTIFGVGLLGLAIAGVLAAIAIARSTALPRWSGTVLAIGLVLFLPQFFTPPAVRIAHGVLLGLGLLWLAVVLWRRGSQILPRAAREN